MAPLMTLIKDISMKKSHFAMKLRLVRLYEKPVYNNPSQIQSLECVFHDSEGDRIYGTIKKSHIAQFKNQLNESRVYAIKYFGVAYYTDKYKTTATKYKLQFHGKTQVFELDDSAIPRILFNFKSFRDLSSSENIDETILFDIIGRVVAMQSAQSKELGGKLTRFIDLTLEDLDIVKADNLVQSISHVSYPSAKTVSEDLASGESPFRLIDHLYANEEREEWQDIPDELASLVDKKVLFKVQVKANQVKFFTGAFSVMRLTTDPDLLKKYSNLAIDSQESDFLSKLQEETKDQVKDDNSSEDEVCTPNKLVKKIDTVGEGSSIKRKLLEDFSSSNNMKIPKKEKLEAGPNE
ncbi:hypothetical protein DH2020_041683 [Rehmannia glutinosa]|uniref:Replication protein A 70 kDa DNA-binding subunit B/D first OB fold domain-containing protein n=1 Tax=Rehmannia glutinosa TaxID=99300 RepID=A0ABR0UQL3_REHGL